MIGVVYGTTGELIKLSPVLMRLAERKEPAFVLCTGQQVEQIPILLDDLGLPQPDLWLSRGNNGHDLQRPRDIVPWALEVLGNFTRKRRTLRARLNSPALEPLIVVHGDTLTTVLGAAMGHALGFPVGHIEAGMRSGNLLNPFPEELDRLAAARLARTHFAPGMDAVTNLRAIKARGEIVDTGANTIYDALELVKHRSLEIDLPAEPFGLISVHRFELLGNQKAFRDILELLREVSRSKPMLFVDHPVTAMAITTHGLDSLFDDRFRRVPRQRYFHFIALLKASSFLLTDSGGSQQECARLGHPCLVHRAVTEHADGLDRSVVLSRMSLNTVRDFLEAPPMGTAPAPTDIACPSDVIIEHLEARGHIVPVSTPRHTVSMR